MGIYDDMLFYLNNLNIIFLFVLVLAVSPVFLCSPVCWQDIMTATRIFCLCFCRLMTGSARIILPQVLLAVCTIPGAGVLLVWCFSSIKNMIIPVFSFGSSGIPYQKNLHFNAGSVLI